MNKTDLVKTIIDKLEKQLTGEADVKATVGDYIRLVQLHEELQEQETQDIEVTWIDPKEEQGDDDGEG